MYGVDNLEERQSACSAFWRGELARPLICVTAPKQREGAIGYDLSYMRRIRAVREGNFNAVLQDFERAAGNTFYGGESFPVFTCDFAPDQYATFFGAKIENRGENNTIWVNKIADKVSDLDCSFDEKSENFVDLVNAVKQAADYAQGNFLISMLDLHSNMDTLSALIGPENLCMELLDDPDTVLEKLNEINNAYAKVYDSVYRAGKMDRLGSIGWHPIWSQGKSAVVQCDFSCMISPSMARRYAIPSIEREANHLDHCVYHYDGKGALGHLDDILSIEAIDCIQWVPGDGEKRTIYWMDLLHKIQEKGKSLWIYDWTAEEILADKELIPEKTAFSLNLSTEEEAKKFLDAFFRKYK